VKFVDTVFGLPRWRHCPMNAGPLSRLAELDKRTWSQDAITAGVSDLLDAFSTSRLMDWPLHGTGLRHSGPGLRDKIPQITGLGCSDLGILTTDRNWE